MNEYVFALTLENGRDDNPAALILHYIKPGQEKSEHQSSSLIGGRILAVSGDYDDIMRYVLANGLHHMNFFAYGGCDVIVEPRFYEEREARIAERNK